MLVKDKGKYCLCQSDQTSLLLVLGSVKMFVSKLTVNISHVFLSINPLRNLFYPHVDFHLIGEVFPEWTRSLRHDELRSELVRKTPFFIPREEDVLISKQLIEIHF